MIILKIHELLIKLKIRGKEKLEENVGDKNVALIGDV